MANRFFRVATALLAAAVKSLDSFVMTGYPALLPMNQGASEKSYRKQEQLIDNSIEESLYILCKAVQ